MLPSKLRYFLWLSDMVDHHNKMYFVVKCRTLVDLLINLTCHMAIG